MRADQASSPRAEDSDILAADVLEIMHLAAQSMSVGIEM
jgi:hypothetical protein